MTQGPEEHYFVSVATSKVRKLRGLSRRAARAGHAEGFAKALREVYHRLATRPLQWGDPLYWLHEMDLQMFRGMFGFLQVYYCVDQVRRIVYIQDVALVEGYWNGG